MSAPDLSTWLPRKKYTVVNAEFNKLYEAQLSKEETAKLEQFIAALKSDFPEDVQDTYTLIRFLRARKWNMNDAEKLYRERMKWIGEYKPHMLTEASVKEQIAMGKMFWYGKDKQGRNLLVYRAAHHFPNQQSADEVLRLFIYNAEIGLFLNQQTTKPPNDRWIIMFDRTGVTRANFDPAITSRLSVLANFYPETIGKVYIYKVNWLFHTLFAIVSKFIDPVTIAKISLLNSNVEQAKEELYKLVDKNQLIPDMGGSTPFTFFLPASTPAAKVFGIEKDNSTIDNLSEAEKQKIAEEETLHVQKELQGSVEDLNLD